MWDAMCGYWQIELHRNSRKYLEFIFDWRKYQFKRLYFRLINSGKFIKCMDQLLRPDVLQSAAVYVDDILIIPSTWEEHCHRVEQVLKRLSDNNITLKLEKSKLITGEVQFLEKIKFILSSAGVTPSPEKIDAIQRFSKPHNTRQPQ